MKKETIKNRKEQDVVVTIEENENSKGLAFVMHGLGGFKEQPHIQVMAEAFLEKGYTVIRFDTTNSIGESGGNFEEATTSSYFEDLEDVISWAESQSWYEEPFYLAGHSLGGISISLYAEKNPAKVKALAPISTVVSGKMSFEAHSKEELENWKKTGWLIKESISRPGVIKKLPWSHMEDRLKFDLLENVDKLQMPVLLIVGSKDKSVLPEQQKIFYDHLPGKKEIHIIKEAPHSFREEKHLQEVKELFLRWIDSLNN